MAADTIWFPFQTQLYVPGQPTPTPHHSSYGLTIPFRRVGEGDAGYGLGVVQDHGSAIKGALHVDLFHMSHRDALEWGKRELDVRECGGEV